MEMISILRFIPSKNANFPVLVGRNTCFFTLEIAARVYTTEFKDEDVVKSYLRNSTFTKKKLG
jgi:hypothetical protein